LNFLQFLTQSNYEDHFHCFGCGAHGDVFDWLMMTRRISFPEAVQRLSENRPSGSSYQHPRPKPKTAPDAHRSNLDVALRCWNEGVDPTGTIIEAYLASRGGLTIPSGAPIRFHPRCQRGRRDLPGGPEFWPAMLSLMTEPVTGEPVGLHRTYLLPDGSGKAPTTMRGRSVLTSRMIIDTWGIVRLAPDDAIGRALGIAEGIENALTAMQIIAWGPVWAVGTQACLRKFPLLSWIEALTIFADADDSGVGLDAARNCAKRWYAAGREARVQVPPEGQDWNSAARQLSP